MSKKTSLSTRGKRDLANTFSTTDNCSFSIIFSSWTHTLDLLERHLSNAGVKFERIDGECPLPRRQKILDDFGRLKTNSVLIMTTGVGAFGYHSFMQGFDLVLTLTDST